MNESLTTTPPADTQSAGASFFEVLASTSSQAALPVNVPVVSTPTFALHLNSDATAPNSQPQAKAGIAIPDTTPSDASPSVAAPVIGGAKPAVGKPAAAKVQSRSNAGTLARTVVSDTQVPLSTTTLAAKIAATVVLPSAAFTASMASLAIAPQIQVVTAAPQAVVAVSSATIADSVSRVGQATTPVIATTGIASEVTAQPQVATLAPLTPVNVATPAAQQGTQYLATLLGLKADSPAQPAPAPTPSAPSILATKQTAAGSEQSPKLSSAASVSAPQVPANSDVQLTTSTAAAATAPSDGGDAQSSQLASTIDWSKFSYVSVTSRPQTAPAIAASGTHIASGIQTPDIAVTQSDEAKVQPAATTPRTIAPSVVAASMNSTIPAKPVAASAPASVAPGVDTASEEPASVNADTPTTEPTDAGVTATWLATQSALAAATVNPTLNLNAQASPAPVAQVQVPQVQVAQAPAMPAQASQVPPVTAMAVQAPIAPAQASRVPVAQMPIVPVKAAPVPQGTPVRAAQTPTDKSTTVQKVPLETASAALPSSASPNRTPAAPVAPAVRTANSDQDSSHVPAAKSADGTPDVSSNSNAQAQSLVSDPAVTATVTVAPANSATAAIQQGTAILPQIALTPSFSDDGQPAINSQAGKTPNQAATKFADASSANVSSKSTASDSPSTDSSTHGTQTNSQPAAKDNSHAVQVTPRTSDASAPQMQAITAPGSTRDDAASHSHADAAPAAPRSAEQPLPSQNAEGAATQSINTARVIQNMSESEMRVGMHSAEFGDISIRTSVSQQQMLAQISVDHGDLGRAISAHIPAMQEKLGGETGLRALVEVSQSGMSFSSERGYSSQREQKAYAPTATIENTSTPAEADMQGVRTTATAAEGYRLDIRA